jgi:hypothetical protein
MAIRGKVKDIKTDPGSMRSTGTVTDTSTRVDYPYVQPYGEQLGLVKDMIVQFETVVSGGVTYGASLDPVERGTIQSINYDTGIGVLNDRFGNPIEFEQAFAKEMGFVVNSNVRYIMVNVGGKPKATSLRLTANQ